MAISDIESGLGSIGDAIEKRIKKQQEKAQKEAKLANIQTIAAKEVQALNGLPNVPDEMKSFTSRMLSTISEINDPELAEDQYKSVRDFIMSTMKSSASEKYTTPEKIQELASQYPGSNVSGKTKEGLSISQKIANIEEEIDKKIAEGTVAERFDIRKEERAPEQEAKVLKAKKEVERDAAIQQRFDDIELNLLEKGIDLNPTQEARVIAARQGKADIEDARKILGDELSVREIFSGGTGALATIASFNSEALRKFQTSINSSIFNYVFAKSGAQVSNKEREAFANIYGPKLGDTIGSVNYKLDKLDSLFVLTDEIIDPNKVAGLTVAEKSARLELIKAEMLASGAKEGDVKTAVEAIKKISDKFEKSDTKEEALNANLFDDLLE